MASEASSDVLTEEEKKALLLAFARVRDGRGFTQDEIEVLLEWATCVVLDMRILESFLAGRLRPDVQRGKVIARAGGQG